VGVFAYLAKRTIWVQPLGSTDRQGEGAAFAWHCRAPRTNALRPARCAGPASRSGQPQPASAQRRCGPWMARINPRLTRPIAEDKRRLAHLVQSSHRDTNHIGVNTRRSRPRRGVHARHLRCRSPRERSAGPAHMNSAVIAEKVTDHAHRPLSWGISPLACQGLRSHPERPDQGGVCRSAPGQAEQEAPAGRHAPLRLSRRQPLHRASGHHRFP
jgi:hypothetical protein